MTGLFESSSTCSGGPITAELTLTRLNSSEHGVVLLLVGLSPAYVVAVVFLSFRVHQGGLRGLAWGHLYTYIYTIFISFHS